MAKKLTDAFGKTPRVRVSLSDADKRRLGTHEWFIEPLNDDTRNAIAQSLQLVDHEGDTIRYGGDEKHGFKTDLTRVLFLHNSEAGGTFKFTPYHRATPGRGDWSIWKKGKKTPPERVRNMSHFFKKGESPLKK
jgi:hypothetical protein